jgi:amino acid adenylation domain-containing protein
VKTSELLDRLQSLSVRVWAESGELKVSAPKGALTDELKGELGRHKAELLALFESGAAAGGAELEPAPRIEPADRSAALPLSFTQQRVWFLQQLESDSAAYNVPMAWTLRGALDVGALERSLSAIVARHEVLRTTYPSVAGRPTQVIGVPFDVHLERQEATNGTPVADWREQLRVWMASEAQRPLDLVHGPVFSGVLAQVAADEHVLFLRMHHLSFDGWSKERFLGELQALYEAELVGATAALPTLPVQYADFAAWQREHFAGPHFERTMDWWRGTLAGPLPVLELPTDRPRPAIQSDRGANLERPLAGELIEAVDALASREGATPFMVILAVYKLLLARFSGLEDVIVGTAVAGRTAAEVEDLIGFFANTLVFRTDLAGDPSFRELVGRVRETCLGAFEHQDVPFERLVDELQPERNLSYTPIYQAMILMIDETDHRPTMGPVAIEPIEVEAEVTRTDLTLWSFRRRDGFSVWLEYSTDLFERESIERMLSCYEELLRAALADPDAPLSSLTMLPVAERERLLTEFNDTAEPFPAEPVHAQFEAQVDRTPDATALLWPGPSESGGDVHVSYRELDERANRLAHWLIGRGVQPDTLVGLNLDRSIDMLVAVLAIQKAGAAYVPLDPGFPRDRIEYMIEDAGLEVVVRAFSDDEAAAIAACPSERPGLDVPVTARMYVIYTSGSTGRPKGVELEHRSVSNFLATMSKEPGLAAGDSWLAVTTLSFDISMYELLCPLVVGGTVILASKEQAGDGEALRGLLERLKPSVMQATPATWRLLRLAGWAGDPELRIFCGGEALPRDLANELVPLGREVWNLYGPTEATIWSTIWRVEAGEGPVLIGRPIGNTQVYVLDAANRPVPLGVPGELWIAGDGLARGYLERAELTGERFLANPFVEGGRMYRTGDLARWRADGQLECLGRIDNQVKLRGFRIELGEIEAVIAEDAGVTQCVAVVREDTPGDQRLVAYLVSAGAVDKDALRERAREKLPAYMVPSMFTELDELPLTPNGKVDRRALSTRTMETPAVAAEYVAPAGEMERRVAEIWRGVLRVDRVAVDTNFFDLGGHSLLLAEVHARLCKELEVDVAIVELFQYPTVRGLAAHLERPGGGRSALGSAQSERSRRSRNLAAGRTVLRKRRKVRE